MAHPAAHAYLGPTLQSNLPHAGKSQKNTGNRRCNIGSVVLNVWLQGVLSAATGHLLSCSSAQSLIDTNFVHISRHLAAAQRLKEACSMASGSAGKLAQ